MCARTHTRMYAVCAHLDSTKPPPASSRTIGRKQLSIRTSIRTSIRPSSRPPARAHQEPCHDAAALVIPASSPASSNLGDACRGQQGHHQLDSLRPPLHQHASARQFKVPRPPRAVAKAPAAVKSKNRKQEKKQGLSPGAVEHENVHDRAMTEQGHSCAQAACPHQPARRHASLRRASLFCKQSVRPCSTPLAKRGTYSRGPSYMTVSLPAPMPPTAGALPPCGGAATASALLTLNAPPRRPAPLGMPRGPAASPA